MSDLYHEILPPMPWSEIAPHWRRRDYLPRFIDASRLFASILWRVWDEPPDGGVYRLSFATCWHIAFDDWRTWPFNRALYRACRARGYACVPCDLVYQLPPERPPQ